MNRTEWDEYVVLKDIATQLTRIADFFEMVSDSWQEEETEGNSGLAGTTHDADD